jgi:UDP-glucose 4-epimerase
MLRQATRGSTLVLHGSGDQTRDYIYVDDVVSAMVAASTAPDLDNLVINVGSGTETSVRELARLVLEVTEKKIEIMYNPRTHPGVSRMRADLTLASQKLGYQPRVSLVQGLQQTLARDPRFRREPPTQPLRMP